MKTIFKRGILLSAILLSIFITSVVLADSPSPTGGSPTGGGGGTPVGAPIDGGLSILLAMGAAYGGKKLYQARKEKKEADGLMS